MEFSSFFEFTLKLYKIIGLDLKVCQEEKSFIKIIKTLLRNFWFWILVIWLAFLAFLSGTFSYLNFDDLSLSPAATANYFIVNIIVGKNICIWWNREKIIQLIKELQDESKSWTKNLESEEIVKNVLKGFKIFFKVYFGIIVFTNVLFAISPIFDLILSGFVDLTLPHPIWLPYEINTVISFLLSHAIIAISSVLTDTFLVCSDLILYALIVVLSLEFDILGNDLKNFDVKTGHGSIKDLVNRHCRLLSISEKLESSFSAANFILFVGSSIFLCFPAFQIVSSDESFVVLKFSFYFMTSLLTIYIACYGGDKLINSSLEVSEKSFLCDWYNCDNKSIKISLMMIQLRARKPVKLTALKFSNISIESFSTVRKCFGIFRLWIHFFLQILRAAYSFLTLLTSMYG